MPKNEIRVTIEGIGGFRKSPATVITLKKGVSVITASNAVGKSSFIKALQLLCPGNTLNLEDILNEYETSGSINLENDRQYHVQILKTPDERVKIVSSKLIWDDMRAVNLGFCNSDSPLVQMIRDGNRELFKRWLRDISGSTNYETAVKIVTNLLREKEAEKKESEQVMKVSELNDLEREILDFKNEKNGIDIELTTAEKKVAKLGAKDETAKYEKLKKEIEKKVKDLSKSTDEKNKKEKELEKNAIKQEEIIKEKLSVQEEMNYLEKELEKKKKEEAAISKQKNEINSKLYGEKSGILAQIVALKTSSEKDQAAIDNLKAQKAGEAVIGECIVLLTRRLDEAKEQIRKLEEQKASLEEEFKTYSSQLDEVKRINRELQAFQREILSLNKETTSLENKAPILKTAITNLTNQITTVNGEISEIEKQMKRNIEIVQELTGMGEDLKNKVINLQKQSRDLDKKLQQLEAEKQQKLGAQEKFQDVSHIVDELEKFLSYLQERLYYIIYGVIAQLNQELSEIFNLMEYTNFSEIKIRDEPELEFQLVRKDGINTKLSRLSTSEKLTLAIIIMFVAKKAYAPDFPFFVIDEIMGTYDKTRFNRILQYIQTKVPYLVVTTMSPFEETKEEINVTYTLPL
jgi:DNA repair exonuclease SbcCD ATPase subunit